MICSIHTSTGNIEQFINSVKTHPVTFNNLSEYVRFDMEKNMAFSFQHYNNNSFYQEP